MKKMLMTFALLPVLALADTWTDPDTGITWTYTVSEGEASVFLIPQNTIGAITTPSTLGGCPVTSIGSAAFGGCSSLTSVSISEGVTSIDSYAFGGCSSLKSVTIPPSVTNVGEQAFAYCSELTSVTIPEGVTSISDFAFWDCSGLTSVTIPSSVTSIGKHAFLCCSGLTNVTISEGVTNIGYGAFADCSGLKSVTIPSSVTSIGDYAFSDCSGLTSVTIQDGVTNIGYGAFTDCSGLTSVTIPSSVTSINADAFRCCSGLTNAIIFEGAAYIGATAFRECIGLTSMTIPSSVTNIGDGAFEFCSGLTSVMISEGVTSIGDYAFAYCSELTSVMISEGVTSIGTRAFAGCWGLTSVDFEGKPPEGLSAAEITTDAAIRYNVAYEDEWLPVISECGFTNAAPYVPESAPETPGIENWTSDFTTAKCIADTDHRPLVVVWSSIGCSYCNKLHDVLTNDAVTCWLADRGYLSVYSVGDAAVKEFAKTGERMFPYVAVYWKTEDGVPNKVTFTGRDGKMPSRVGTLAEQFMGSVDNILGQGSLNYETETVNGIKWAFKTVNGESSVVSATSTDTTSTIDSLTIPSALGGFPVTSIGEGAFDGCVGLASVTIPSSVTSIGKRAFNGCCGLTSVTIPSSVTSIGDIAFSGCSGLGEGVIIVDGCVLSVNGTCPASVELTPGTRLVADGAFQSCYELTRVTIPSSVISIGREAFYGCSGLTSMTISEGVTSIGEGAFDGCVGLTSVTIPSSVTSIGRKAFSDCSGLTNVTISEGVTSIGVCAFDGCWGLTGMTIPSSVTNIGDSAFAWCSGLTSVTISEGVTSIGGSTFFGCSGLTSVMIPPNVTRIGDSAFAWCDGLTSVTISEGVTNIGKFSFEECSSLTNVTIPSSVTSIGDGAFCECDNLRTIYIREGEREKVCELLNESNLEYEWDGERLDLDQIEFIERAGPSYGVYFDLGEHGVIRDNRQVCVSVEEGYAVAAPSKMAIDYGYELVGWSAPLDSVTSNMVVRAIYAPVAGKREHRVTFLSADGDASASAFAYSTNSVYGALPEARRDGFTFAGWYTSFDGGERVSAFSTVDPSVHVLYARWAEDDVSLYAQWEENKYSVAFHPNGGEGAMSAQPFLYDQTQNLSNSVFTKTGYTFKGWATSADGEVVYKDGESVSNLTAEAGFAVALFAKWEKAIDMSAEEIEDWLIDVIAPKFAAKSGLTEAAYRKQFKAKFGDNYADAFFRETGKVGQDGRNLQVWHDYVAGADPLNTNDVFTATITFDANGVPKVEYKPTFADAGEAALRKYTTLGKVKLTDEMWDEVKAGEEANYNFFKVTVEMR